MPSKRETQGAHRTNYGRPTSAALITGRQFRQGRHSIYRDPDVTHTLTMIPVTLENVQHWKPITNQILFAVLLKNDTETEQWTEIQITVDDQIVVLLRLRQSLFRSITIDLSKKIAMSIRCYTGMWTDNFPISALCIVITRMVIIISLNRLGLAQPIVLP